MGKNMSPEVVAATPGAPVLDDEGRSNLSLDRVLSIVTDTFTSATERHIEVGDGLEMCVFDRCSYRQKHFSARLTRFRLGT
jgi:20S proteasome subunit beta 6